MVGERENGIDLQAILETSVHGPTGQRRRFEYAKLVGEVTTAG